jgi:cytochrome b561
MNQFSHIAKTIHWLVAGLIVSQYILAKLAENAKNSNQVLEQLALLANHKSLGITILALAVIRLAYRFYAPAPKSPASMSAWQITASKTSHVLLYSFLFALPLTGWLMSSAKAYSVSWFNVVVLPDFVAPNEALGQWFHGVHHYLAEALFVIAVIHILAALKHHFIDKDDVLTRMVSRRYWLLYVLVVILLTSLLGRLFNSESNSNTLGGVEVSAILPQSGDTEIARVDDSRQESGRASVQSDLPLWNIDYKLSSIKFIGDQAGAPFEGEWQQWSADIQFDENQLEKSRFNVSIDLSSGFSNDRDRDDTIRSSDFFNVDLFPTAYFRADIFSRKEGSYQSVGKLTMKGIAADAILSFDVIDQQGSKVLIGSAPLDRFKWNIGTNDWADTTWVGQDVMVEVRVVTKP